MKPFYPTTPRGFVHGALRAALRKTLAVCASQPVFGKKNVKSHLPPRAAHQRYSRTWVASALLAASAWHVGAPASAGPVELPQMGDTSGALISPEEEKRLGEAFMREVRRSLHVIDDPELTSYIQSLGNRLVSQADSYLPDFTFFIVDDPAINAFAAPGGYIGIHSALILATDNESELASVMAHEIAHITQRHLPRSFEAANKMSLPTAAALIAAMILGRGNGQIAEAALATTLAGSIQTQINFTRANEQEADRIGMQILANTGLDPRGMPGFFEKLQASYRFYENNLPEFLSTHPVTLNRIADSRGRAEQYPTAPANGESLYPLMRARTRALTHNSSVDKLAFFKAGLEHGSEAERAAARYGYGLMLLESGKLDEARQQFATLLQRDPERIPFISAMAAVDMADKRLDSAIERVDKALRVYPDNPTLTLQLADALIKNGRPEEARHLLQEYMRKRPPEPTVFGLYARAASEAGREGDSHYALAEQYYYSGETSTALQQLKLALESVKGKDFYLTARIEARTKELKDELAASAKESRH
jgi:predicted Zn-dependent protease